MFCILVFAPVQRNWACFTWKGALEISSILLSLLLSEGEQGWKQNAKDDSKQVISNTTTSTHFIYINSWIYTPEFFNRQLCFQILPVFHSAAPLCVLGFLPFNVWWHQTHKQVCISTSVTQACLIECLHMKIGSYLISACSDPDKEIWFSLIYGIPNKLVMCL